MANIGRKRLDGYGRPLPHLLDPPARELQAIPFNRQQQALIEALLTQEYETLLVKGVYAEVTLTFVVRDGRLQPDVYLTRCQQHRLEEEPR